MGGGGRIMPPFVTLVFLEAERQNLVTRFDDPVLFHYPNESRNEDNVLKKQQSLIPFHSC